MRKTLDTLIRLQRNEIDRLRMVHNALLDRQDAQFQHLEQIADSLKAEQSYCQSQASGEEMTNFGSFSRRMMQKKDAHHRTLQELEPQIEASQLALNAAFAERKRYEILSERREEAERLEQETAAQQFLDENTILRYQRSFD